ncbi:hypothetical protein ACFXCZ_27035 [Streptomyces sp. NPDC059396]|uniref:hypothetical protein n=1 Tax=Streptomyces sp. NPDC059396 TaxID=3346819 RepID=UPI0036B71D2E
MPTPDPYGQGIQITTLTDAPDAEALARALAGLGSLVPRVILQFASAADRSATLTGDTAPAAGMASWLIAEKRLDVHDGTAWRQVPLITAETVVSNQESMPGSWSADAFTDFPAANWAPITATVPPSGKVAISIGAACQNTNTNTSTAWAGWRATGALTESSSERNAVSTWGGRTYATRRIIRPGLTPGATLTVTPRYLLSSLGAIGTETRVSDGQLSVEPLYS